MTKAELKDQLMILRESMKGKAKWHTEKYAEDMTSDYDFGFAQACEYYEERIRQLMDKI
jgi:hypothetical protein